MRASKSIRLTRLVREGSSGRSIRPPLLLAQKLFQRVLVLVLKFLKLEPSLYLGIHVIEGQTVTPMLLAKRFTINPVLVIISLVFWFWMWGIPGMILAVPMLAITKIVCDRVQALAAFGHFLEA
jgi:predicted PurR-regulated permease PerM